MNSKNDLFNKKIFENVEINKSEFDSNIDSLLIKNQQRLKDKLDGIIKQIEQYKTKKVTIANDIKNWTKSFHEQHNREPNKDDKQIIKSTYSE